MNVLFFERADGGVSQMALRPEDDPQAIHDRWAAVADPAWMPIRRMWVVADPVLPPRRFRDAWGAEDDAVKVRLPMARWIRRKELLGFWKEIDGETHWSPGKRDQLLHKTRTRLAKAEKDGNAQDVKKYKDRERDLLALDEEIDARLAAITDLAVLDTWEPVEFQES